MMHPFRPSPSEQPADTPPLRDSAAFGHLYPFRSRYLTVNGHRLHYIDQGAGEPVVMVHGNPTWSFYFRVVARGLSDRYRTIVPDHIGCGLSEKPDPRDYDYRLERRIKDFGTFLDSLCIKEKITLVLHDWGGMIAMAWAVRHPERIGRIVLTNTAAFPIPRGKSLPIRLRLIRNTGPLSTVLVCGLNLFALGAVWMASAKRLPPPVRKGLIAPYDNWRNRIATLKFVQDIPIREKDPSYGIVRQVASELHRVGTRPLLICWGMKDFVFDADYLSEWRRRFPHAEIHTFPHAGHYLLEDAPEEVLHRIREFLERHPL